jgi:hypothetical protein
VSTGDGMVSRVSSVPKAMVRHPDRLKRWAAINEMIRQQSLAGDEKTRHQQEAKGQRS